MCSSTGYNTVNFNGQDGMKRVIGCEDIDECTTNNPPTNNCTTNETCVNIPGWYKCVPKPQASKLAVCPSYKKHDHGRVRIGQRHNKEYTHFMDESVVLPEEINCHTKLLGKNVWFKAIRYFVDTRPG